MFGVGMVPDLAGTWPPPPLRSPSGWLQLLGESTHSVWLLNDTCVLQHAVFLTQQPGKQAYEISDFRFVISTKSWARMKSEHTGKA